MRLDAIIRVVVKLILPFMLLFALYVQLHGELGPGGGFQAGVISAGTIILYALIFGVREAKRIAPERLVQILAPAGVLIFAGTGIVSMLLGANFLDYSPLGPDKPHGQEYGIISVELGVLVTVASSMLGIFYAFVDRGQ